MTDFTPNKTAGGNEWDVNDASGTREVELEYIYVVSPASYHTDYLFLTREDLVAMLAALDASK